MPRTIGQAIGFLLGFAIALWLSPFAGKAASSVTSPAPYAVLEAELHAQVLAVRAKNNLIPLLRRGDLDAVARDHAADMAARSYLNHVTPEGANPVDDLFTQFPPEWEAEVSTGPSAEHNHCRAIEHSF